MRHRIAELERAFEAKPGRPTACRRVPAFGALLTLSGQTAFGRNWLNTCRSTLSPGTWWILFHAVLDFGDSGSGTFFIKVSTGRTADTDPPDSVSADHDGYATDCIGDVG